MIFPNITVYNIFDQINEALVSIRDVFQNCTNPKPFNCSIKWVSFTQLLLNVYSTKLCELNIEELKHD